MRGWLAAGLIGVIAAATPASAQEDGPRFCPNRPTLGSSACTTEPGRVHLEMSLADWTRDDSSDERQDTVLGADFQARIGLGASTEAQVSWTPFGHVRTRDKLTGAIDTANGVGDVRLAIRQNLRNPDGKGLSFGLEPFVTLPVGRASVGAGDWGAGLVVPVTYDVSEKLNLGFTTEGDAAVNESGDGRHFAISGTATLGYDLTKKLTAYAETQVLQDNDPGGHTTQFVAASGLSYKTSKISSVWAEAVAGLNRDTPDIEVFGGFAVLF